MRFSLRRRVEALSYDEIDNEIDRHQKHAEELVDELQRTLEEQSVLWRSLRKDIEDAGSAD
jgi:hypothetical protein